MYHRHQQTWMDVKKTYHDYPEFWVAAVGTLGFSFVVSYIVSFVTLDEDHESREFPNVTTTKICMEDHDEDIF